MKFELSEQKLTDEEFTNFINNYKLNLPISYKNIILKYNGGYPEKEYFEGKRVYFKNIKYGNYPLEKSIETLKDVLPKGFYPFCDVYGQLYCINLNKDDYEKIYFFDESGEYELVAESFESFMNQLSDDPDY